MSTRYNTRSNPAVAAEKPAARRFGTNIGNTQRTNQAGKPKIQKKGLLGKPERALATMPVVVTVQQHQPVVEAVEQVQLLAKEELSELLLLGEEEENNVVMNMSLDESLEGARESLVDIDAYDLDDPQSATEYVNEIYKHLRFKEDAFPVDATYMETTQPDLSSNMRKILLDWLFDVHLKFKLLNDTLWMTVDVIDRFLAVKEVSRRQLQLVGVTAMLIASKYEEIYAPEVRDFVYICDNAYSRVEILEMERLILNTLNFEVCNPTSLHFLRRFSKAARSDSTGHTMSKYLLEVALQEYHLIRHRPSMLAAACVYLGRNILDTGFRWGSTLLHYTGYTEKDVAAVADEIAVQVRRLQSGEETRATSVYRKYSTRFFGVSKIPLPK